MTQPIEHDARPYPARFETTPADTRPFMAEFEEAMAALNAAELTNEECRMAVNFVVGHTPAAIMKALEFIRFDRDTHMRWHAWRGCPNSDQFEDSTSHAGQCRVCYPRDTPTAGA